MGDKRQQAIDVITGMLPTEAATMPTEPGKAFRFGGELAELAIGSVFEPLWTRPGIDKRTRSMITVAMLIALRATHEMEFHIPAAVRNGVTLAEIEEIIYHATGYAGFPAAMTARVVAEQSLRAAGMLE